MSSSAKDFISLKENNPITNTMPAPEFIPLEEPSNEGLRSTSASKRKYEAPTPDSDDSREFKRLRLGDGPGKSGSRDGSSSPLSTVPSENVPTQFGFNVLQVQRESYAGEYGLDYHRYALKELETAIERYESVNPDSLLDDDAIEFLIKKLEYNVLAKRGQVISFCPSTSSSSSTEAGPTSPGSEYVTMIFPRSKFLN